MSKSDEKLRVMLVDDHRFLSESFAKLLNEEKDIFVCGIAPNLEEASKVFVRTSPDVVLLDLDLGNNESGFTFLEKVKADKPFVRVIILSTFDGVTFRNHAQSLGADDYIAKGVSSAEIVHAIRQAAKSNPAKSNLGRQQSLSPQAKRIQLFKNLSESEKRVLLLLIGGKSQKEIAAVMGISASTVNTYVTRARDKFGARSLAHLISIAETVVSQEDANGIV